MKETSTENNKEITATTGETRTTDSSTKETGQGDISTVSSVDTGAEKKRNIKCFRK